MEDKKVNNLYLHPIQDATLTDYAGITLRDFFASKIITGAWQSISQGSQSELAKRAYEIADVMLKQREKL